MVEPTFGVSFTRDGDEPRAVIPSDMSTIGLVGTAPDANEELFPLDTPIHIRSNNSVMLAALGNAGTLRDSVLAVNDQLGDFQAAAEIVIVRVEQGANEAETIANIIGDEAVKSGIFAFLLAGSDIGKIPRIIAAPGFTHQQVNGATSIQVSNGGTGYTSAPAVSFTGGGGGTGLTAHATLGSGANAGKVASIVIDNPGSGYTAAPVAVFTGGVGTGAVANVIVDQLANAVAVALPSVLSRLLAHAVVEGPGTTELAAKNWRETLSSERLIPVDCWVKVSANGEVVTKPGAARIAGLIARTDFQHGGAPMHSAANQPIQGIVGLVRSPGFSLTDGATEGQSLLAANIGIAVRGELGVESAIAGSGFVFIGTDNAADDPLWQFYNVTRGRDYIHLGLLKTLRTYLGRFNIENHVVQAILNTATIWLGDLQSDNHILGFRVGFDQDQNTPENLRLGKFAFYFQAEEPPVLRKLDISSRRYRPALEALVEDLLATTQPSAAA